MELPASLSGLHLSLGRPPWPRCSYLCSSSLLAWALQAPRGANLGEPGSRDQTGLQEEGPFVRKEKGRIAGRRVKVDKNLDTSVTET